MASMLSTGTKSVLFGVHQFLWHPFTVYLAWRELYGNPSLQDLVCILVHDLGYLGKSTMNGPDGIYHPELGATIAGFLCGKSAALQCLGHSRAYASRFGFPLSKLCWADKLSPKFDPAPFYWIRASLSNELAEYRKSIPWEQNQSSFSWVKAFKSHVQNNSDRILAAAKGIASHGYNLL